MRDLALIFAYALGAALCVGGVGAAGLRLLRGRSITAHVGALLALTVTAVAAGVAAVAEAMFLSVHDRDVVLITVAAAAVVSVTVGWLFARRLAAAAVWADQARARERHIEQGRRDLVAWVSHDLRTPLAGLRAMAEALEDRVVRDRETVDEYHRRIRVETDRMTRLVDDLFELSRINAGALRLTLSAVPLGDVVSDALASTAPLAAARRIRLEAADAGWPTVLASEPELARVVANLLLNAVRYTPYDGTVRVEAGRDGDNAWLAVADTCGGIPDVDLPRVFDVAFRGEPARTPRPGNGGVAGSGGLGLAIVRGLVEAHGGRVSVRNVSDGCRFEVRLPVPGT
ncbi:sensor histidine kinase [Micromonospora endolithica]|uniref:Sensor-like histidine kinase SenX3 n=1 Tax=Micromonospora endolithica TaxID=230091 RepID=A0A3A9ZMN7_9ACTN|nr:HAMP domain-containing sensor histidine kinase [Micromonospora endolithica]RKN49459.1 sensor histidine kinase [Micromonospora endolithica]TWJ23660.1 histidine kinase/DNA gyrase B/HSP90-like ATPase [Micromonospora endolithica]